MSSPGTRFTVGFWYLFYTGWGVGLGGVDPAGSAAGVGEGAVFTGLVMAGGVGTDKMFPDADLDRVADDGDLDLDLAALVYGAGVVVLPGEADVPGRINLAGHRYERR